MTTKYYKLSPKQIFEDIIQSNEIQKVTIRGKEFFVFPHVYPSDRFRTTNFVLDSLQPLFKDFTVCDMGCGLGIVGLFALQQGAKSVVQVDINSRAIENAKANKNLYRYSDEKLKIYESDCFDYVPKQIFDIIIFNIPFHSEPYEIEDPLEYAFHDPVFSSTKKFFRQVVNFCHSDTRIFIAFSSKGNVCELEKIFDNSGLKWKLWKSINNDQEFDNRIYELKRKNR